MRRGGFGWGDYGPPEVPEPIMVDESTEGMEDIHTFEEMDSMILEACGYSKDSPRYRKMMESSVADSDEEKIFAIDRSRSYHIDETTEEILKDETFDRYWHEEIYDRLDDEEDAELLEQWTPEFMGEEVRRFLSRMSKDETFYYVEFFKEILSKSSSDDALELLDFDDETFERMPKVVRIF